MVSCNLVRFSKVFFTLVVLLFNFSSIEASNKKRTDCPKVNRAIDDSEFFKDTAEIKAAGVVKDRINNNSSPVPHQSSGRVVPVERNEASDNLELGKKSEVHSDCLDECKSGCCQPNPYCPSPFHMFQCCLCCECCNVEVDKYRYEVGYNKEGNPVAVGRSADNVVVRLCCDCPGRKSIDNVCQTCCFVPAYGLSMLCFTIGMAVVPFEMVLCSTCWTLIHGSKCLGCYTLYCLKNLPNTCKKPGNVCSKEAVAGVPEIYSDTLESHCCYKSYVQQCSDFISNCWLGSCIQCLGGVCYAEEYLQIRAYSELKRRGAENVQLTTRNTFHTDICGRDYRATKLLVESELMESQGSCSVISYCNVPPAAIEMK